MVLLTEQIIKGKTRLDKLEDVKNLNLWGQELDDISILQKLSNVEVLSLSVNKIGSLKDFRHCSQLKELYLRKNEVADLNELQYLTPLKELKVLWLCDNPCADLPGYKQTVLSLLPHLEKLDNDDLVNLEREAASKAQQQSPPRFERALSARSSQPHASPSKSDGGALPHLTAVQHEPPRSYSVGGGGGAGGGSRHTSKNILYAVMALVSELDEEDLVYVKREIEQRLGG